MITKFFFYDKLKCNDFLEKIHTNFVKDAAYLLIKSENDLEPNNSENQQLLYGVYVEFPLSFAECMENIIKLKINEKDVKYKCEKTYVTLIPSGKLESAYIIYRRSNHRKVQSPLLEKKTK